MKKVTAVLLGAGGRGNVYSRYSKECPEEFEVVAVAEPDRARREKYCAEYRIAPGQAFEHWEELLARPKLADVALVCTMDNMHTAPAIRALELGYHVLLEKPMAGSAEECRAIADAAEREGLVLSVCHVLRYTPFYGKLKELIEAGTIGTPVSIDQIENVGYWHYAHSFVRGNWRNTAESSPMILAKCCHDMDILSWLLGSGLKCTGVASYGGLSHFTAGNAPAGAPARCLDGCPAKDECPYYAPRFYLEHPRAVSDGFVSALTVDRSREGILKALEKSPYGRCVYRCDNDVVDHQVVCAAFENGAAATLTMTAFTQDCDRTLKITGTRGEVEGDMEKNKIVCRLFGRAEPRSVTVEQPAVRENFGHDGGDFCLMRDFVRAVRAGGGSHNRTTAAQSLQSHLMCFAAEEARLTGKTVSLD